MSTYPACHVSPITIARYLPKHPLIHVKYYQMILKITRRICKYPVVQISRKEKDLLAWDVTFSAATPLHCLAMTRLSNWQNLQKVDNDIVIFNGNVLSHAWYTWYKKGTNGKKMSCSLLICHMQIFKLIDFRTMGLWKWITCFFIRTVHLHFVPVRTEFCLWTTECYISSSFEDNITSTLSSRE